MTRLKTPRRGLLRHLAAGGVLAGIATRSASARDMPRETFPCRPRPAALRPQMSATRQVIDLSGLWSFRLDHDDTGQGRHWHSGFGPGDDGVRSIAVPGSWNEQFPDTDGFLGIGWYCTTFELSNDPSLPRTVLRVGSAVYAATVWIDGQLIGTHSGGHLPFEFEITPAAETARQHTLVIKVDARLRPDRVPYGGASDPAHPVNNPDVPYDFFPYSGLHRAVVLQRLPRRHIEAIATNTRLQGTTALLDIVVNASDGWSGEGTVALGQRNTGRLRFENGQAIATLEIPDARLWHPTDPHLHPLALTMRDGQDTLDSYTLDIGLRTVHVEKDRVLLNNRPIRLRGTAMHEDFPVNGRGQNLPVSVKDLQLLRWIGGNSFRTSHYPYAEETLDLADRMGLLVIGEIPAVDLAFADRPTDIDARLTQCKQDFTEMFLRDRNRPSIIMWSLANEPQDAFAAARGGMKLTNADASAATGLSFFRSLFAHARRLESFRPLTLVGMDHSDPAWVELGDVMSLNRYPGWYDMPGAIDSSVKLMMAEFQRIHAKNGKPILLTEFGADAIAGTHRDPPEIWSEEYQADLIEAVVTACATPEWILGAHVWCLNDFRTAQGVRRPESRNFKGLFTRDRTPKEAAHRLRKLWG